MTRYVWHQGQWLQTARQAPAPSRAPMIIRDHMDPVQHPCTGEILESKSAFRALTRAHGCVEMGNDAPIAPPAYQVDRKELRADIANALQQHEQGYRPPASNTVADDVRIYGHE